MLAGIRDFLHLWQIPLLVFMLLAWFWLGSSLLLKSLTKRQYPKRIRFGDCVLIMLLVALAAGLLGLGAIFFIRNLCAALDLPNMTFAIIAAPILTVTTFIAAWLVFYAMLELSLGATLKAALKPLLVLFLIEGALVTGGGLFALAIHRTQLARNNCMRNIGQLNIAFHQYFSNFSVPAPDTQVLVDRNFAKVNRLACPAASDRDGDYFYHPADVTPPETLTKKLLLCDFARNHPNGRNVLRINGDMEWVNEKTFQQILQLPENAEFAKALAEAEAK